MRMGREGLMRRREFVTLLGGVANGGGAKQPAAMPVIVLES